MKKTFYFVFGILLIASLVVLVSASLGPEELADPSFDDSGEWTTANGWVISSGAAVRPSGTGSANLIEANPFTVVSGVTYEVTVDIASIYPGQSSLTISLGGDTSPTYTSTGTKTFSLDTVDTSSLVINDAGNGGTPPLVLTSMSIKEVLVSCVVDGIVSEDCTTSEDEKVSSDVMVTDAIWTIKGATVSIEG